MAEIRKIVRSSPLSNFSRVAPVGGSGFAAIADMARQAYDFLAPAATERIQQERAEAGHADGQALSQRIIGDNRVPVAPQAAPRPQIGNPNEPPVAQSAAAPSVTTTTLQGLVDQREGGGDYRTLFGFANRDGGAFSGTDITQMSIGQLVGFASRDGAYGRHQINQLGYLATPMGRYQVVGSTLRNAAQEMGLSDDTLFTPDVQDQVFAHLARRRLSGPLSMEGKISALREEWDGFRHVPDAQLAAAIQDFEAGNYMPPARGDTVLRDGAGSDPLSGPNSEWDRQLIEEYVQENPAYRPLEQRMRVALTRLNEISRQISSLDPSDPNATALRGVLEAEAEKLRSEARPIYQEMQAIREEATSRVLGDAAAEGGIDPRLASIEARANNQQVYDPRLQDQERRLNDINVLTPVGARMAAQERRLNVVDAVGAVDHNFFNEVRDILFPPTQVGPQVQGGYEGLAPASTAPVPAPQAPAPTLIRNGEGRLEARLFSPMSDPILQAGNAAYLAAVLAETGMAIQADLMSLSQQHADDPEGFLAAARQYSDQTAANTDPRLRRDVRAQMDEEINRRYLGMLDQQYRTTQARAEDALSAQAEMWSQDYAAAIASGNADEIARTQARLQSVLAAREAMPGSTWSPERSQLFMRNAQQAGQRQIEQQREQRAGEYRDSLRTIIAARRDGLTAADETVLSDPAAWAADPALAQEAAAWIEFRDQFPAFEGLPPAQQQAVIADLRAQPVQDEYQIAMIGKAEEAASAGQRAWAEDPIARAAEVLPTAPPPIPAYDPANPQAMMNALTARAEYANGLVQQGYVARPTFFSRAEADDLSLAMGKDMPDEVRLALAQAVASGLGDNAIFAFDQLDLDPVLGHSGRMLASGGDAATAMEALRGQRMLDEGLVSIPAALTRIDAVAPEISEALSGIPANDVEMLSSITAYAQAIYAANARGVDPDSQQAKDLMATAIQRAMGQSEDANGRTTGGVQRVLNGSVWLPVGMSGDLVNERLRDMVPPSGLGAGFQDMAEAFNDSRDVRVARWRASQPEGIAPSLPYVGTQPMPANLLRSARLVPVGGENGSVYRMEIVRSGTVLDVVTESGDIFYLDLKRMMEAP